MGSILFYAVVFYLIYWLFSKFNSQNVKQNSHLAQDEAKYLVGLLAKIAKSDGRVSELEADLISQTFDDMIYQTGIDRQELKRIYNYEKERIDDAYSLAKQYRNKFALNKQILIARLTFFLNLAYIDGEFSPSERRIIADIAAGFGVDEALLNSIIYRFDSFYTQQKSYHNSSHNDIHKNPYKVLELPQNASFDEVKKRYKELVRKYHPDILMGRGESEMVIEQSTRKLQEINEAYEMIKRGKNGG